MENVQMVLEHARLRPFTTKSDIARALANEIAVCACDGLITTRVSDTTIGNIWMITADGLEALEWFQQ